MRDIARYTLQQWGPRQQRRYARVLAEAFQAIAERRMVPRRLSAQYPQVLVNRCEHHYIFYLHPDGHKPKILAVLHESMDMLARLRERFTD